VVVIIRVRVVRNKIRISKRFMEATGRTRKIKLGALNFGRLLLRQLELFFLLVLEALAPTQLASSVLGTLAAGTTLLGTAPVLRLSGSSSREESRAGHAQFLQRRGDCGHRPLHADLRFFFSCLLLDSPHQLGHPPMPYQGSARVGVEVRTPVAYVAASHPG
jgi:hypothetical protein